ncbi:hypothetical protein LCGC14_1117200 [marine sediment metagenome]|uniref:Uncharacterized protein n=1 Tax=marine sediment metagenome TaxID=412755 RepID=A0A0F9M9U2_9ZZZZ
MKRTRQIPAPPTDPAKPWLDPEYDSMRRDKRRIPDPTEAEYRETALIIRRAMARINRDKEEEI